MPKNRKKKVVTRKTMIELTPEELMERGEQLAKLIGDKLSVEAELKEISADYKARLKKTNGQINSISETVRIKKELREVECYEEVNPKKGTAVVYRLDNDKRLFERALGDDERQMEI